MAVSFAPELIPVHLLAKLAQGEASTPLPPMPEMLAVTLLLEIVREAGLRAPKSISHTVSLVGALIIGETAVSAGIISVPVLTMAAAATIATLAVPALYEQSILFRFAVILLAGLFGVPGLACGALLILAMACGSDPFGYDYLYPLMPPGKAALRDGFVRAIWSRLAQKGRCCRAMQKSNVDFYPVLLLSILADTLLRLHTGYWARAGLLALPASAAVLAAVLLLVSTSWQGNALLQKVLCVCWQSVQHWKFCACTPCLAACTPVHWGWRAPVLSCWHRSSTSGGSPPCARRPTPCWCSVPRVWQSWYSRSRRACVYPTCMRHR